MIDLLSNSLNLESQSTCQDCSRRRLTEDRENQLAGGSVQQNDTSISRFGGPNLVRNLGIMLVIALLIVLILILARALKIMEGRCACAKKVRTKI